MQVTRKQFLGSVAAAAAAALVPFRALGETQKAAPALATATARYQTAVNSSFWVRRNEPGDRAELVLLEVVTKPFPGGDEQFSLHFLAPQARLAEGAYFVEHRDLGESTIFLARQNEDARGIHYRADFNLRRGGAQKP